MTRIDYISISGNPKRPPDPSLCSAVFSQMHAGDMTLMDLPIFTGIVRGTYTAM